MELDLIKCLEPIIPGTGPDGLIPLIQDLESTLRVSVAKIGARKVVEVCDAYLRQEARSTSLNGLLVGFLSRYPDELAEIISKCLNHLTFDTVACGASKGRKIEVEIIPSSISWKIELGEFYEEWTGCRVWPGAIQLARMLLLGEFPVEGEHVLEIGSGLGLCGISAIEARAKSLAFTEYKESLLGQCRVNAKLNCSPSAETTVSGFLLDWNEFTAVDHVEFKEWKKDKEGFVVIGSELIYEDNHGDMIVKVISQLFSEGASRGLIVIMLKPSRAGVDHFLSLLRNLDSKSLFTCRVEERECDDEQLAAIIQLERIS
jgi:predicted nicotinamide N-methyase